MIMMRIGDLYAASRGIIYVRNNLSIPVRCQITDGLSLGYDVDTTIQPGVDGEQIFRCSLNHINAVVVFKKSDGSPFTSGDYAQFSFYTRQANTNSAWTKNPSSFPLEDSGSLSFPSSFLLDLDYIFEFGPKSSTPITS
jgi:hypothetical protein